MPNVTISVPDELKAEMDKFTEVSWSEICRNAISQYIAQRKNPTPNIELDLREARLDHYSYETGYPALTIPIRIHNKTQSEITVDRIKFNVRVVREDGRQYILGSGYDLYKKIIGGNSVSEVPVSVTLHKEKIESLAREFTSTFYCYIRCVVFVDGFRNPYNQEVKTRIPIDDWQELVERVLETSQSM